VEFDVTEYWKTSLPASELRHLPHLQRDPSQNALLKSMPCRLWHMATQERKLQSASSREQNEHSN
jgi:hypothetical protein